MKNRSKPVLGDEYYCIIIFGGELRVSNLRYFSNADDVKSHKLGNYFLTKREAQIKIKYIKKILKGKL